MMTVLLLLGLAALGGQEDKAADEALEAFKGAIKSSSEADRVSAVNELAKVPHAKTLKALASLLTTDAPTVRIAAARGISGFSALKKQAAAVLVAAMGANTKDTTVHAAIYESIGKLDEDSTLPALHRGFEEKETAVAKAAIQAAGQVASAASIDPLIELLKKLEKLQKASGGGIDYTAPVPGGGGSSVTVRSEDNPGKRAQELIPVVNKALNDITRESNGSSETWSAWWARNKGTFKPAK
jgi:HEAT repeat protein